MTALSGLKKPYWILLLSVLANRVTCGWPSGADGFVLLFIFGVLRLSRFDVVELKVSDLI